MKVRKNICKWVCLGIYIWIEYVYVFIHMIVCVHVCRAVSIYIYVYICMHIYTHTHTHIYIYIYVCICACPHTHTYTHIYIYIYKCMNICICICIWICISVWIYSNAYLSIYLSACICVCLSTYINACLHVYLCVCACVWACGSRHLFIHHPRPFQFDHTSFPNIHFTNGTAFIMRRMWKYRKTLVGIRGHWRTLWSKGSFEFSEAHSTRVTLSDHFHSFQRSFATLVFEVSTEYAINLYWCVTHPPCLSFSLTANKIEWVREFT